MKVLAVVLSLCVAASARMAYQFSDGYLNILGAEPAQTFECAGRSYGYYADVATDCQVFHVCVPIVDQTGEVAETHHFSFFCPNQTVFSQDTLTCAHPDYAFPCADAESLYDFANKDFGRIPEGGLEGFVPVVPQGLASDTDPATPVLSRSNPRSNPNVDIAAEDDLNLNALNEETLEPETDAPLPIPASVPEATLNAAPEDTPNAAPEVPEVEDVPEVTFNTEPSEVAENTVP